MARVVVAAGAAAVVGYLTGNPQLALTTFAVVYGSTAPNQQVQGPRLDDLRAPAASYGSPLLYLEGSARVPGCIAWASTKREISTTTEQGGKGGGGADVTTYTYEIDLMYRLTCNQVAALIKVFDNGRLIWTKDAASDAQSRTDSLATTKWRAMRFYAGGDDQLPDPTYEAAVGVGNAPAYRGGASVFFEGLQLGSGGQLPLLTFEIATAGDVIGTSPPAFRASALELPDVVTRLCERTGQLGPDDIDVSGLTQVLLTKVESWRYKLVPLDDANDYSAPGFDDSSWNVALGPFGDSAHPFLPTWPAPSTVIGRNQAIWMRKQVDVRAGAAIKLEFAADNDPTVWFEGQQVALFYEAPFRGTGTFVPVVSTGTLVMRVADQSADTSGNHIYAGLAAKRVDLVHGMPVGNVSTTRQVIDMLRSAYFFDVTETDRIAFVTRGGPPALTIPFEDLGASESGEPGEPLPKLRRNDVETPAGVAVKYSNLFDDYQDGLEPGDRILTNSAEIQTISLALVLTPAEARRIADINTATYSVAQLAIGPVTVTSKYTRLQPADVVLLLASDGSQYRVRITKKTESALTIDLECELDDASTLSSEALTDESSSSSLTVRAAADTEMLLLDIPILRDADDVPGFYVDASAVGKWPGASFRRSVDGVVFDELFTITDRGTFGVTQTALAAWTGGNVFDETSSVQILIEAGGQAESFTREQILASRATGAYLIGDEILQARDATLVGAGVYVLRGLLRGRRGTEHAMAGHSIGERAVVLRSAGIRKVEHQVADIGLSRTYKAITLGKRLESASAVPFVDQGIALKPFSPVRLRATRTTSGDITFRWTRRTRMSTRFVGSMGINAPLGEAAELYAIEIWNGTYTTLLRTFTGLTTNQVLYTAAQQVTDFGSTQANVKVRVYQLSASVGRGFPLQAAA